MQANSAASDLIVLDLGLGLGAALIASHLADVGARVLRLEPVDGDPFYGRYPAYRLLREKAEMIAAAQLDQVLASADVCILGGEDFPGLPARLDADALSRRFPRLVVLELSGGVDGDGNERPAVELLAQARSGLCFEQYSERPLAWALPVASFGMALQGMIGVWAALVARERTGSGQLVRTSLQHGAALTCAPDRITFEHETAESRARIPLDVRQLIFRCADGHYVQFAMQRVGSLARVYKVLGIPGEVDPLDSGAKRPEASDPRDFFGDFDLFAEYVARQTRDELLAKFWENGIPADAVNAPGECWDDEQVRENRIIRTHADGSRSVALPLKTRVAGFEESKSRATSTETIAEGGPLAGLRVVGMGTFIAGPFVGKILADLGADVIKVDGPGGDPNTRVYTAWWACNTGKRSIVVDVKTDEGRETLRRLCASADLFHHNFRPGVAERIGVDPASLRRIRPDILTLESSAYGATGPKAELSGLDPILQAISGQEVRAGGEGNPPLWYRTAVVDYTTGCLGAAALLMNLYAQYRTGAVSEAQVNLLDSALFLMSELIQTPEGDFVGAPPVDAAQLGLEPAERIYRARDGWLAIAVRSEAMAQRLAEASGADLGPLGTWDGAVADRIAGWMAERTVDQVLAILTAAEVWADTVVRVPSSDIERDPAAVAAGLARRFEDPVYGRMAATGPLFQMSRTPLQARRAPAIGENTAGLLKELGASEPSEGDFPRLRVTAA